MQYAYRIHKRTFRDTNFGNLVVGGHALQARFVNQFGTQVPYHPRSSKVDGAAGFTSHSKAAVRSFNFIKPSVILRAYDIWCTP